MEDAIKTLEIVGQEKLRLQLKRDALVIEKKEREQKLLAIKTLVRTSGRMPNDKYKQCCESQRKHSSEILRLEGEISGIKAKLRELSEVEESTKRKAGASGVGSQTGQDVNPSESEVVRELVALRQFYQEFAADHTRVSSMRQMAAEFVTKLNPVIRGSVNKNRRYSRRFA